MIKVEIESTNLIPALAIPTDVRSRLWPGRRPSIPPLLQPANDFIALTTSEEVAGTCIHEEAMVTVRRSFGDEGCLERRVSRTSGVNYIKDSLDDTTRTAPAM